MVDGVISIKVDGGFVGGVMFLEKFQPIFACRTPYNSF
jgi:hypothetical protein